MDSEDEELEIEREEDEPRDRPGGAGGPPANRLPLHHFMRLIVGHGRMMEFGAAASNDDLVRNLKRGGVIQSDRVYRALQLCARDLFVPPGYRGEALVDAPIRVEALGFNISAPHMHATCLEALALQPGHKLLDVGSGCGVLTACGAYLVGRGGVAVGIDARRDCVSMGREAVRQLIAANQEFASSACPVRFELENAFMPAPRLLGQFDRVHVGASCPPDRLVPLLALLRPEGGLVVVPVSPNDLRVITKRRDGSVSQKVISQVRFSDLEVPSDAEVLLAQLRHERRSRTAPADHPSTYVADVAAIAASQPASQSPTPSGSYGDACGAFMPATSPSTVFEGLPTTPQAGDKSWPHRLHKLFSSCSSGSSAGDCGMDGGGGSQPGTPATPLRLSPEELGEPDCLLAGAGWSIPVHRSVLRQRCDQFRARCDTGWADCSADRVAVPEQFSREAVEALLHYVYHDGMEECGDPQEVVGVLHVALYFSCPRLVHLCELRLAALLRGRDSRARLGAHTLDEEGLADAAAALLSLADDNGLGHLRAVALDYIVHHHEACRKTEAYAVLSRHQVALVAEEACRMHSLMVERIRSMAQQPPLPPPSY